MGFVLSVAPHSPVEQSRLHQYRLRELAELEARMVKFRNWQDE